VSAEQLDDGIGQLRGFSDEDLLEVRADGAVFPSSAAGWGQAQIPSMQVRLLLSKHCVKRPRLARLHVL